MKNFKKRFMALFLVLIVICSQFLNPGNIKATDMSTEDDDGSNPTYTIDTYYLGSGKGRVYNENGNLVSDHSFCLDSKETPPSLTNDKLYRVKLSSLTHTTNLHGDKTYTDEIKRRLITIEIERDAIAAKADQIEKNIEPVLQGMISSGLVTSDLKTLKRKFKTICKSAPQKLVWACVYDSADWTKFISDDGSSDSDGKPDNYYISERNLGYFSPDPVNDEYSLWNIFYVPLLKYIDDLYDANKYFENGYDAWVYIAPSGVQYMLGGYFREINFSFVKYDKDELVPLSDAKLQILDKDGNVVDEWVSDAATQHTTTLYSGELYTLHEVSAPLGYVTSDDVVFRVKDDGTLDTSGYYSNENISYDHNNGCGVFYNRKGHINILKVDENGNAFAGAMLKIIDADGKDVDSWTSTTKAYVTNGTYEPGVVYELVEASAQDGYACITPISFYLDEKFNVKLVDSNGNDVAATYFDADGNLIVKNEKTSVKISKVDIANSNEIAGASLQLLDKDGNVLESWISTDIAYEIVGLKTGESYTIRENVAPRGYLLTTDIDFVLEKDGSVTTTANTTTDGIILVEDELTEVLVSKIEAAGNKELAGATITLTGDADWDKVIANVDTSDDHEVTLLKDDNGDVIGITWTSTDKILKLKGLVLGNEYTMSEVAAPEGYFYSENITFVMSEDLEKVEMVDEADAGKLVIIKSVDGLNVTDEEKAGALKFAICDSKGRYLDETGALHDEKVEITLSKFTKNAAGLYVLEIENVFSGEYTVTETNSEIEGYDLKSSSVVSADGTVTYKGITMLELKDEYSLQTYVSGASDSNSVNTGDNTPLEIAFILLMVSGAVAIIASRRRSRN